MFYGNKLMGSFSQHCKKRHHLLTLKLFQTCLGLFLSKQKTETYTGLEQFEGDFFFFFLVNFNEVLGGKCA